LLLYTDLPHVGQKELTFSAFLRLFHFIGQDSHFDQLPFLNLRSLCGWLRTHMHALLTYTTKSNRGDKRSIGMFTSRWSAQQLLNEDSDVFYCLRLCEGRYDRLVEDQCHGERQPVHRQLVCTTRAYTVDGNAMPGRFVNHLLLNVADEKTPRQRKYTPFFLIMRFNLIVAILDRYQCIEP
jgi:hypothetical protein